MSFHVPQQYRLRRFQPHPLLRRFERHPLASEESDGNNGCFVIPIPLSVRWGSERIGHLSVIASDGAGWEHVSVSTKVRCPTWMEMCFVKGLFWDDEDLVIQYHPRKSEYVNQHPRTLHLWRPVGVELPTPPAILVGIA
jgi:hypothetical protein